MSWVAVAVAGSAIVTGYVASRGADKQADAANAAADASQAGSEASLAEIRRQYDQTRADFAPWRGVGAGALNNLARVSGIYVPGKTPTQNPASAPQAFTPFPVGGGPNSNGTFPAMRAGGLPGVGIAASPNDMQIADIAPGGIESTGEKRNGIVSRTVANALTGFLENERERERNAYVDEGGYGAIGSETPDMSPFFASPDYNFRRTEGMRDIGSSFASRGGAFSGNALRALSEFNSNLAGGEFGNWWNRQAGLAGVGQAATNSTAAAGQSMSNNAVNAIQGNALNQGNALMAAGNARASGIQGVGNAINQGVGNYLMYDYLRRRPA